MSRAKKAAIKSDSDADPALPSSTSAAYIKVLKDYSLIMEYKRLKHQSPTGVYVLPATDTLRRWYGVIFLRKGHYRGAIFKFVILIPPSYPDEGPKVHFLLEVFHPLIHPDTGLLDLTLQFPQWSSNQHYIVLLLCYIKKIFYKTEWWEMRSGKDAMNPKATQLWIKNKDEYLKLCEKSSAKSQTNEKLYSTPEDPKMSIHFDRPRPAHEEAFRRIVCGGEAAADLGADGVAGRGYIDWFQDGVNKLDNGLVPVPFAQPISSQSKAHLRQAINNNAPSTGDGVRSNPPPTKDLVGPLSPISPVEREAGSAVDVAPPNAAATDEPSA